MSPVTHSEDNIAHNPGCRRDKADKPLSRPVNGGSEPSWMNSPFRTSSARMQPCHFQAASGATRNCPITCSES